MLACARLGAVHSVVFGGFAAASLAARIDDAQPKLMVTADGGSAHGQGGHLQAAGRRVDQAREASADEGDRSSTAASTRVYARRGPRSSTDDACASSTCDAQVPCVWLESERAVLHPLHLGTTGQPKGVQRDTGGYAVALAASMKHIFCGEPGETMFTTSDIGWVVGHSYIVYGPLIAGMTTILYEGRADPARRRHLVEDRRGPQGGGRCSRRRPRSAC